MNLTRVAVVFILIVMPFMLVSYVDTLGVQKRLQGEEQIRGIMKNAVNDSTTALKLTAEHVEGSGSKNFELDTDEIVNAFLASYHYGLNAIGTRDKIRADQHLLSLVIVGYDGYYIYGTRGVIEPSGNEVLKPVLSEKIPYTYEDAQKLMSVTLDDYVRVLDKLTLEEQEGDVASISVLPTGIDKDSFDKERQKIIRDSIIEGLSQNVSAHNRYVKALGVTYEFYVPLSNNSSQASNIEDVGVIAVFEGYPLGGGQTMDLVVFNQSEVVVQERVKGYSTPEGYRYYCHIDTVPPAADTFDRIFGSAKEAAIEGYYPAYTFGDKVQ